MKNSIYARLLPLGAALTLLTGALTGCGGGGGSSPAIAVAHNVTVNGTLLDSSGAPLAGYKVVYTPGVALQPQARIAQDVTVLSTTTDDQGHYTLSIPAGQITGTVTVYDTDGALCITADITLPSTGSGTVIAPQTQTITVPLPPAPPSGV